MESSEHIFETGITLLGQSFELSVPYLLGRWIRRPQAEDIARIIPDFLVVECQVNGASPLGSGQGGISNGFGLADMGLMTLFHCADDCFRFGRDLSFATADRYGSAHDLSPGKYALVTVQILPKYREGSNEYGSEYGAQLSPGDCFRATRARLEARAIYLGSIVILLNGFSKIKGKEKTCRHCLYSGHSFLFVELIIKFIE